MEIILRVEYLWQNNIDYLGEDMKHETEVMFYVPLFMAAPILW